MSPLGSRPTPVQMFSILAARSSNRDQQWQSSPNPRTLPKRAAIQFGTPEKVGSHGMKRNTSSMAEALGSCGCSPMAKMQKSASLRVGSSPTAIGTTQRPKQCSKPVAPKAPGPCKRPYSATRDHSDTGSALEADFVHCKRHKAEGKAEGCLRCRYVSNPKALEQHARLPSPIGRISTSSWLEPSAGYMRGSWALGCRICAWYYQSSLQGGTCKDAGINRKHKRKLVKDLALLNKHKTQARFSKFASFTFRQSGATWRAVKALEQHGHSQGHELAVKAMLQKEAAPQTNSKTSGAMPTIAIDHVAQQTFKGRVPKPLDWLDCFVESSNHISWRKQATLILGRSGKMPKPSQPEPCQPLVAPEESSETHECLRKRRRKQTQIMAECVRNRHRKVLRNAQFCSLALDEAQGRKLLHFRCDYHEPPWYYQGTLGVYTAGPQTLEEGVEDHAVKSLKRLDEFFTKFCTPLRNSTLGTECDQGLKDHLLKIVVTISADGGPSERRALFLACGPGL